MEIRLRAASSLHRGAHRAVKPSFDRVMTFHKEGHRKFPSRWQLFCEALIAKGADPQIAELILAQPNAVEVVHALFINAELMAELVSKKTRRARIAVLRRIGRAVH
jgi:hypothetical protein